MGITAGCKLGPDANAAADTLSNLPDLKAQLPKSLQAEGDAERGVLPRALGDAAVITESSLSEVKSQGWYDLQANIGLGPTTELFYNIFKSYAKSADQIPFDEPFDLGLHDAGDMDGDGMADQLDFGTALLKGTETDMEVFWFFSFDSSVINPSTPGYAIPTYIKMSV